MDPLMMEFLEQFEMALESRQKNGQLRMLNFACAEKVKNNIIPHLSCALVHVYTKANILLNNLVTSLGLIRNGGFRLFTSLLLIN